MNIYVGNLPFKINEEDIRKAFAVYGTVTTVNIIKDPATQKSRGFAFVQMANNAEAQAAIAALNGKDFLGRPLTVNEARPRTPGGGGGGNRRIG
jgi:RNA recognition motif-containing protein